MALRGSSLITSGGDEDSEGGGRACVSTSMSAEDVEVGDDVEAEELEERMSVLARDDQANARQGVHGRRAGDGRKRDLEGCATIREELRASAAVDVAKTRCIVALSRG